MNTDQAVHSLEMGTRFYGLRSTLLTASAFNTPIPLTNGSRRAARARNISGTISTISIPLSHMPREEYVMPQPLEDMGSPRTIVLTPKEEPAVTNAEQVASWQRALAIFSPTVSAPLPRPKGAWRRRVGEFRDDPVAQEFFAEVLRSIDSDESR